MQGDFVLFDPAVFPVGTVTFIYVQQALPNVAADVYIQGGGRAGIDGTAIPGLADGLMLGRGVTLDGLAVRHFFGDGVVVMDATDVEVGDSYGNALYNNRGVGLRVLGNSSGTVTVRNNRIGTDFVGTVGLGNCQMANGACAGVLVEPGTASVVLQDCVIVATMGIVTQSQGGGVLLLGGTGHVVQRNQIGVDSGSSNGNLGNGIEAVGLPMFGTVLDDNTVSSNGRHGVMLSGTRDVTVSNNRIGLDATGLVAQPNGLDGVRVFGSFNSIITGNTISANLRSGVRMLGNAGSGWQSSNLVSNNIIGLDIIGDAALGNGLDGVATTGLGGGQVITGNVLSANGRSGLVASGDGDLIQGNVVGLDLTGTVARGNGTAGAGYAAVLLGGNGIVFGGPSDWLDLNVDLGLVNVVSGNLYGGIEVRGVNNLVEYNLVGSGVNGEVLGNVDYGIRADAGDGLMLRKNLIVNSQGPGIDAAAASGALTGLEISENRVGAGLDSASAQGNGSGGIRVSSLGGYTVTGAMLRANQVRNNGGVGIELTGALTQSVELDKNLVAQNALCAIRSDGLANGGIEGPVTTFRSERTVRGTYVHPPGAVYKRFDVFWDSDDEASRYLGGAFFIPGNPSVWWMNSAPKKALPLDGRITMVATFMDGRSSPLGPGCGDGCVPDALAVCDDGNACTDNGVCTGGDCTFVNNDALTCYDGDPNTVNDTCVSGVCEAGAALPNPVPGDQCKECDALGNNCIQRVCTNHAVDDDGAEFLCSRAYCDDATGVVCEDFANNNDYIELDCDDGNSCIADVCNPGTGQCLHQDRPTTFVCDDLDKCTGFGTCDGAGNCNEVQLESYCDDLAPYGFTCTDPAVGCEGPSRKGDGVCDPEELCGGGDCFKDPSGGLDDDSDDDGISDAWELAGGWLGPDGVWNELEETNPILPNIYVEVDYMGSAPGPNRFCDPCKAHPFCPPLPNHDHQPLPGVLDNDIGDLHLRFLGQGVRLYFDATGSEEIEHHEVIRFNGAPSDPLCDDFVLMSQVKQAHFAPAKRLTHRYVVFGHRHTTCAEDSSGKAPGGGANHLFVTLDNGGTVRTQQNTLMHELGHNLGLSHHGSIASAPEGAKGADYNFKPNYLSVMNYRYQMPGLKPIAGGEAVADYSILAFPMLDEGALDEDLGLNSNDPLAQDYMASYTCWEPDWVPNECVTKNTFVSHPFDPNDAVDWDCSGGIAVGPVTSWNINRGNIDDQKLDGYNDWENLSIDFTCKQNYANSGVGDTESGPEYSVRQAKEDGFYYPIQTPDLVFEPSCLAGEVDLAGAGAFRVAVLGGGNVDVTNLYLASLQVGGAPASGSQLIDVDSDGVLDLLAQFPASWLPAQLLGAPKLPMYARTLLGEPVYGKVPVFWAAQLSDPDGDGVMGVCDLCPNDPAPPASVDGCSP